MDEQMQLLAAKAAQQLLLSYRETHPEWRDDRTPVDAIVSWLDLAVETFHPEDYEPGTYGFLEDSEDLIWLCRDLQESFRRFTLAHELGHAMLHRSLNHRMAGLLQNLDTASMSSNLSKVPEPSQDDPCQEPDVQEDITRLTLHEQMEEVLGVGESYNPRSERELAANIFAAELLMPLERVRSLYLDESVSALELIDAFGVSSAALLNRLAGLLNMPVEEAQAIEEVSAPSSAKKRYDEFQQAAIEAKTPALIVAGPGSGKTSTLIGRIEYLINTLNVPPEHILALTFSRKAAQEMQERLQQILNNKRALPAVSTFHAFCANLLRKYAELAGLRPDFELVDDAEGYFILRRLAHALPLRHYRNLNSPAYHFPDFLQAISRAKDELVTPEEYARLAKEMQQQAEDEQDEKKIEAAERALEVASVYTVYQQGLRQRGDCDFGGLVMQAVQLLQDYPEIRYEQWQQYQHILVDEFQDMNRASGVLLRELAGEERRVWVVGDSNQAIYGFRGASPANIGNFQHDYPGATILPLSRNYRSLPDIVYLAESFRSLHLEPETEPTRNQPTKPTRTDAYITLALAENEASETAGIIQDIRYKHQQGYHYRDMVILCRTRAHARRISRALVAAQLPIIESGGMLEQEHIKALLSMVLLVADSSGMGILRVAKRSQHPLSQADIEALILQAKDRETTVGILIERDEPAPLMSREGRHTLTYLSRIMQGLRKTSSAWELLARYLFMETNIMRDLLAAREDKLKSSILADYTTILQVARRYDQQQQRIREQRELETKEKGEDAIHWSLPSAQECAKGLLDYLNVMLLFRLVDGQAGNSRQESAGDGEDIPNVIRVMTVHASKGLEFPVIYLPGLVQQKFPLQAPPGGIEAPEGMLPAESVGKVAHESGEACLFYVGVTRAREHLVLSYTQFKGKKKAKQSVFLEPLLKGLPEERISSLQWLSSITTVTAEEEADDLYHSTQLSEEFIRAMQPEELHASAIETYSLCPRQYAYSSIYGFRSEAGPYQHFRQATLKTIEALHTSFVEAKQEGQFPTEIEARQIYTQHWHESGGHTSPFAPLYEAHGYEIIEQHRRQLVEGNDGAVSWILHPQYDVEVAGKPVKVTVDRVEAVPQSATPPRFVRNRFGKSKDKPQPTVRDLLISRAYQQQHPEQDVELQHHNLSTNERVSLKITDKKAQALIEQVQEAIAGIEQHIYTPSPDPYRCPSCPFFLVCPA